MTTLESQLHGYRQGHQLLAASATLPKLDQSVIDRLSDVAGPLRSGECFAPYLSAYPLPSGAYYVLARTWQDLSVQRAGCVRTLSLLIPTESWSSAPSLSPFLDILASPDIPMSANQFVIPPPVALPLPPMSDFHGGELLEALFLEDPKPIVVLDAPDSELIAVRLLTALWPSMRERFAVCTFALSPRRIEGRDFDLIFAPKSARSRFADWPGRRIDGQTGQPERHRWTSAIVNRVFNEPIPRLLGDREIGLAGADVAATGAALRIGLLWEELVAKLDRSPSAVLGLIDIANSRRQIDPDMIVLLRSVLGDAVRRAVDILPEAEAWQFISALAKKICGTPMTDDMNLVASAARLLARSSPAGAIELVDQPDPQNAIDKLIPEIANGMGEHFGTVTEEALLNARPQTLVRLLAANGELGKRAVSFPLLVRQLEQTLPTLTSEQLANAKVALLAVLIDDAHSAAAQPLLAALDSEELLNEVRYLASANSLAASSFVRPIVERARQLGAIDSLRDTLLTLPACLPRDEFVFSSLTPSADDITWLINDRRLSAATVDNFLVRLLQAANADQFRALFDDESIAEPVLVRIPISAPEVLSRAALEAELAVPLHIATTLRILAIAKGKQKVRLALKALEKGLPERLAGDEAATISILLAVIGGALDGEWAARCALDRAVTAHVLNRNLIAFNGAPAPARMRIVEAVDEIARAIESRGELDLDSGGANALAQILWSAGKVDFNALISASGRLIPLLLRSTHQPVSTVITATFPNVYQELAQHDNIPDILRFIPFFDWDRCKAARRELVDAFVNSSAWKPEDLVLTACLCSDLERILRRTARSPQGHDYMEQLIACLPSLPDQCRQQAEQVLSKIRSEPRGHFNPPD